MKKLFLIIRLIKLTIAAFDDETIDPAEVEELLKLIEQYNNI